ncbi:hypothetical protein [Streptomyces sp. NPDC002889]|uniref:hypothetical protein n=1 Tax=Streptomyces sp. NPDC002889 TaxID=3364669 RepID=UPI00368D4DE6
MALTPPDDGVASYYAPLTLYWFADDLFSSSLAIPWDMAEVLSDADLAAIVDVVDNALKAAHPTLRISRHKTWTPQAPSSFDQVTVQEASG